MSIDYAVHLAHFYNAAAGAPAFLKGASTLFDDGGTVCPPGAFSGSGRSYVPQSVE